MRVDQLIDSQTYQNASEPDRAIIEQNYIKKFVLPVARSKTDVDLIRNDIRQYKSSSGITPQDVEISTDTSAFAGTQPVAKRIPPSRGFRGAGFASALQGGPLEIEQETVQDLARVATNAWDKSLFELIRKERITEPYEPKTKLGKVFQPIADVGVDLPFYALGTLGGGLASGGNPIVAGAMTFMVPALVRTFYEARIRGDIPKKFRIDDWESFLQDVKKTVNVGGEILLSGEMAWNEAMTLQGAGKLIGKIAKKFGPKFAKAVSVPIEAAAFTATGRIQTGNVPTNVEEAKELGMDYYKNMVLVGALKGYGKAKEVTKRTILRKIAERRPLDRVETKITEDAVREQEKAEINKDFKRQTEKRKFGEAQLREKFDDAIKGSIEDVKNNMTDREIRTAMESKDYGAVTGKIDSGLRFGKLTEKQAEGVKKKIISELNKDYTEKGIEKRAKALEKEQALAEKDRSRDPFEENVLLKDLPAKIPKEIQKEILIDYRNSVTEAKDSRQKAEALRLIDDWILTGERPKTLDLAVKAEEVEPERGEAVYNKVYSEELKHNPEGQVEVRNRLAGKPYEGDFELKKYGSTKLVKPGKVAVGTERKTVVDTKTGEVIEVDVKKFANRMPVAERVVNLFKLENWKFWGKGFGKDPISGKTIWEGGLFKFRTENFERKIELDGNKGGHEFIVNGVDRVSFNTRVEVDRLNKELDVATSGKGLEYEHKGEKRKIEPNLGKNGKPQKLSFKEQREINDWLTWQDPDGKKTMKEMEIKKPELNKAQKEVAEWAQAKVEKIVDELNIMEQNSGVPRTEKIKGYWTLLRKFSLAEELGIEPSAITKEQLSKQKVRPRKMAWIFGKERLTLNNRPIERNFKQVMKSYLYHSTRYKHYTPMIQKIRDAMTAADFQNKNPRAFEYVDHFLNYITGTKVSNIWPWVDRQIVKVNRRVGRAIIPFNAKVIGSQGSAIIGSMVEFGIPRTLLVGGRAMFSPAKLKQTYNESPHIKFRILDIALEESKLGIRGRFNYGLDKFTNLGTLPMRYVDLWVAMGTYNTAKSHYMKKLRPPGISNKEAEIRARKFANKKVVRTQATAEKTAISQLQYTPLGKAFTLFGTFGINKWNWLMREVIGRNNPNISKKEALKKMTRFLAYTAMLNSAYEFFGTNPPDAAPISAAIKSIREDMGEKEQENFLKAMMETVVDLAEGNKNTDDIDWLKAALNSIAESGELLPIGSRLGTWGPKGAIGAPATLVYETAEWLFTKGKSKKGAIPPLSLVAKWAGVPGAQEVYKRWRAAKRKKRKEKLSKTELQRKLSKIGQKFRLKLNKKEESIFDKIMDFGR